MHENDFRKSIFRKPAEAHYLSFPFQDDVKYVDVGGHRLGYRSTERNHAFSRVKTEPECNQVAMTPRLLRPRDSSSRKTWCARTRFGSRFAGHLVSLPLRLYPTRAERLGARRRSRCALELARPGAPKWTLARGS